MAALDISRWLILACARASSDGARDGARVALLPALAGKE